MSKYIIVSFHKQTSQKKSKAPVQLDLGNMLMFLEQKQQSQKSKHDVKSLVLSGCLIYLLSHAVVKTLHA